MAESVYGYEVRSPFPGEDRFFRASPHVAGMAAEDRRVVLNPHSGLSADQQRGVAENEAIRLHLQDSGSYFDFPLTGKQQEFFANTPYANSPQMARHSLVARIATNDPSAMDYTFPQKIAAESVLRRLNGGSLLGNLRDR